MAYIQNPILRGFNPDPSIMRVGQDYYIATSTFEWFPGVQIHHSRDLKHWRLLTRPLSRKSQLDMLGDPDSGGVWAPCLSYADGVFYLVFTDMKSHIGPFKDAHNYLVTATDIEGPWSDPVYLNSSGFDPSLFHDVDKRQWLVNMVWDHRQGKNKFGGILMQEYSPDQKKLVGPIHNIFRGTELGLTEAPHLYKRGDYYYLLTAEGGTRLGHAVTQARSKSLFGPFEADPKGPLLTAREDPQLRLQRAGHASLVQTPNDEWYMPYLCGRPLRPEMRCTLGRETAIEKVEWTADGWLKTASGVKTPQDRTPAPDLPEHPFPPQERVDAFDQDSLSLPFQTLRVPLEESWASLQARPGYLRIKGQESLSSHHRQSLIARRVQAFRIAAETKLEFEPENYQQMAGLICYYNTRNFLYACVTHDETSGPCLRILKNDKGIFEEPLPEPVAVPAGEPVRLKVEIDGQTLQFHYARDDSDQAWQKLGPQLDASLLSDENAEAKIGPYLLDQGFTGAFVGLCVQDLSQQEKTADFSYFSYEEQNGDAT